MRLSVLATAMSPLSLALGKRILFLGTPEVAASALTALLTSPHQVVAAVTMPPAPAGRNKRLTPSPVQLLAEARGLPVLCPESARDPAFLDAVEALAPDLCITVSATVHGTPRRSPLRRRRTGTSCRSGS